MTRRLLFKALAGAAAMLTGVRRMVARPLVTLVGPDAEVFHVSVAEGLPVNLAPGERLSVSFAAVPSRTEPFGTFIEERGHGNVHWAFPLLRGVPEQHLFIARGRAGLQISESRRQTLRRSTGSEPAQT